MTSLFLDVVLREHHNPRVRRARLKGKSISHSNTRLLFQIDVFLTPTYIPRVAAVAFPSASSIELEFKAEVLLHALPIALIV
jgi:hypothetical protein